MQGGAGANNADKMRKLQQAFGEPDRFNSVLLCPKCFQKELQRMAATPIEP
jgi:hypothetical protein